MGAQSSSPRTVSLDNDIPVGVIDVSEDVVQRLKGLHAQARKEQREQEVESTKHQTHIVPVQVAPTVVYGDSTVTALEVRRQKEQELRNNDLYWQKRLRQQEESLKQSSAALEKEFNETFKDVRKRFENAPAQHQLPPCKECKSKIIECYKANANQPLNCSNVVADFTKCVEQHRSKLLQEKYSKVPTPAAAAS